MSNRKLNPMRSTLPGEAGTPKKDKASQPRIEIAIDMDAIRDAYWDLKIPDGVFLPSDRLSSKKHEIAMEKQRVVREREQAERARRDDERKAKHEAELKLAADGHREHLDEVVDPTLRIVLEMHVPESRDRFAGWFLPEDTANREVVCASCGIEWPCPNYTVMSKSLVRRRATDPFVDQGGIPTLLDGAL